MKKIKYEIDPHNRLTIPYLRKVLDGRFKTDKNNTLIYHIKAPVLKGVKIPHQVKLQGKWSLTKDHNLLLTLDKWARQTFGDKLTLKGDIIDVNKNSIIFALTTKTKDNKKSIYTLKLKGSWQADKYNRITFDISREKGRHDILTFYGTWKINKKHQIIYKYQKSHLITKTKTTRTLIFKGYWNIKDKAKISYIIDKNSGSILNLKTSLGIFKKNYIKYKLGVGLSNAKRTIFLYGAWKIKKNLGLLFEIEYDRRKIHAIIFGAKARLTKKDTVTFNIRNSANKDTGIKLELSHNILKGDGRAFLRLLASKQQVNIVAGAGFRW